VTSGSSVTASETLWWPVDAGLGWPEASASVGAAATEGLGWPAVSAPVDTRAGEVLHG